MILAALAVVLFCLVGTAAIMGWLPSSVGGNAKGQLSEADRLALATRLQQGATQPAGLPVQPLAQTYPAAPVAVAGAPQYPAAQAAAPYPAQPLASQYAAQPAPLAPPAPLDEPVPVPKKKVVHVASAEPDARWCGTCGNVESIRAITHRAQGSGLGAGAGAVLGGLLGHQIGGGNGRQLATVAGAVGGAVVGNQVEGNIKASTSYEIRVRLDDGTLRTFHQQSAPRWRNGDRVRIVKGSLRSA
jgi:outer membrane lipoprotein SlyB